MILRYTIFAVFSGVALSACSLAPELSKPQMVLPQEWALTSHGGTSLSSAEWWQSYNDVKLDKLVLQAFIHNSDILLAAARVEEARALAGNARAQQMPGLDASAGASRGSMTSGGVPLAETGGSYGLGSALSYELDIWGRLANASKAAKSELLAVEANARAVKLGIVAETASSYFAIAALNEQITLTRQTIATRENTLKLEQLRLSKGDVDALSVRQAESQLVTAQSRLPALEQQRETYVTALSVLIGQSPDEIMKAEPFEGFVMTALPAIPPLPSKSAEQIVISRPDIIAAEHRLTAANANIGVARAAYLPRISLSGLLQLQSSQIGELFDNDALWNAGANASVPLLDFGRARTQVEAATAREKQAYITYEKTVRTAFGEIRNALVAREKTGEQEASLAKQVKVLDEAERLARRRFDAGYSGYLDVLDAERSLFDARIALIEAKRQGLQSSVDLYRAIGGE